MAGSRAAGGIEDDRWLCPMGTSSDVWGQRMQKLLEKSRLLGCHFCTNRERLRELARQRGVHHLDNLAASPV